MSKIEESIELEVPVNAAYNQWTQFEEFPRFMEGVEKVQQLDDTHTHWVVSLAGKQKEFDAEITEQIPDTRIAWKSTSGVEQAGAVDFHPLDAERCQIMLALDAEPEGAAETAADMVGILRRRVRGDLERFKEMLEDRGRETGAWRGEVDR
ncbi:MAG: SRPBCC family protein [Gaiellaceae bacterium]